MCGAGRLGRSSEKKGCSAGSPGKMDRLLECLTESHSGGKDDSGSTPKCRFCLLCLSVPWEVICSWEAWRFSSELRSIPASWSIPKAIVLGALLEPGRQGVQDMTEFQLVVISQMKKQVPR